MQLDAVPRGANLREILTALPAAPDDPQRVDDSPRSTDMGQWRDPWSSRRASPGARIDFARSSRTTPNFAEFRWLISC